MWCMSRPSRKIEKERFVRCLRFLIANPRDRVFGHRIIEIKVFLLWDTNDAVVLGKDGIKLTGFSTQKSPEIVKAQRIRPTIKRPRWSLLRVRCEMPLADRSGVITVGLKNLCN